MKFLGFLLCLQTNRSAWHYFMAKRGRQEIPRSETEDVVTHRRHTQSSVFAPCPTMGPHRWTSTDTCTHNVLCCRTESRARVKYFLSDQRTLHQAAGKPVPLPSSEFCGLLELLGGLRTKCSKPMADYPSQEYSY